jgi:hypothetical protein
MELAVCAFFGYMAAADIANREPFDTVWWICVMVWLFNCGNILMMALA